MKLGPVEVSSKGLHVSRVSHASEQAAPPPASFPIQPDLVEHGTSGKPEYGRARLMNPVPALRWPDNLITFQKMRRDAQYRASLLLIKAPVLSAEWYIEPFSPDPVDVEAAEFVWWALNNMHRPFLSFVHEALYGLDYGHYAFEEAFEMAVWQPSRKGAHSRVVAKWLDFAPRHPLTLTDVETDSHGRPVGWWHTKNSRLADRQLLDWNKLLVYTWDEEADDPRGHSVAESAYENHHYKHELYKIDAIQKERHGIGIPDIQLPPGNTKPADKRTAHELGRNLRTNEKAYVVRPVGWEVGFIELKGNPVDVLKSADHHNFELAKNLLTGWMASSGGSDAKDKSHISLTERALRYLAGWVAAPINHQAIPQLCDYNFDLKGYPRLKARRVTDNTEARALAVTVRNLIESGALTPTNENEAFISDLIEFPQPNAEAQDRSVDDRLSANGNRGEKARAAANPNRDDAGNAAEGQSPSGNPTE